MSKSKPKDKQKATCANCMKFAEIAAVMFNRPMCNDCYNQLQAKKKRSQK
jgi:hypothetical protein